MAEPATAAIVTRAGRADNIAAIRTPGRYCARKVDEESTGAARFSLPFGKCRNENCLNES
jgi:hypothetical protein